MTLTQRAATPPTASPAVHPYLVQRSSLSPCLRVCPTVDTWFFLWYMTTRFLSCLQPQLLLTTPLGLSQLPSHDPRRLPQADPCGSGTGVQLLLWLAEVAWSHCPSL